jgi:hypothetical protein
MTSRIEESLMIEPFSPSRRRFMAGAALAGAAGAMPSALRAAIDDTAVWPFRVAIPQADIATMKRRIGETRWADTQPVADDSQGVRRQTLEPLMRYWAGTYDWRRVEAQLNALPMFMTRIDGLDIQFIHVRSRHAGAFPMILIHGWPGSILEFLKVMRSTLSFPPSPASAFPKSPTCRAGDRIISGGPGRC